MNRTVVIGGVGAAVVLLGGAAYLLLGGKSSTSTTDQAALEDQGPIKLNPVEVITDNGTNESPDGRTLTITFPKFDLNAKSGETTSAVFSTTWRLKLAPDERALVAVASLNGYMKSTAVPAPIMAPAPAAPAPAATPATPPQPEPAAGSTPPAEATPPVTAQPAAPATPPPAKPVAGDGMARVVVMLGTETSVTEWIDITGTGADHKLSKAVAFVNAPADLRNGSTVPVTVTVELSGATSAETMAKINGIDLKLFAESAPLPQPTVEPAAATPAVTDATATPAPADAATTTPPATETPAPAPAPAGTPTP
ncbi:MAG: hypothetical protein K8S25_06305 [Alphaproteobacteria bacterium]|nr:hypothetical protein [Alphaproteobacteria bacterium]